MVGGEEGTEEKDVGQWQRETVELHSGVWHLLRGGWCVHQWLLLIWVVRDEGWKMCYEASPEHATSWIGMTGLPRGRSSIWARPRGMSSKHEIVKSKRRWPPERWNCPGKGTEAAETGWGWGNLAPILSKLGSIRDKARRVGWGCTEERVKFRCSGQWWKMSGKKEWQPSPLCDPMNQCMATFPGSFIQQISIEHITACLTLWRQMGTYANKGGRIPCLMELSFLQGHMHFMPYLPIMGHWPCRRDFLDSYANRNQPLGDRSAALWRHLVLGSWATKKRHLGPMMRQVTDRRGYISRILLIAINKLNWLE